jgi:homoserine dehydrogenase
VVYIPQLHKHLTLASVFQHPNAANPKAEIIIITHDAIQASLKRVLEQFNQLDVIDKIQSIYRVEG